MDIRIIIDLLRLRQWVKNFFILTPFIFSGRFMQSDLWLSSAWTMLGFCFVSSGMYIINDIMDLQEDRIHLRKAQRPLASGKVTIKAAQRVVIVLVTLGSLICLAQGMNVFMLAICYVLLHMFYNLRAKHVVILDVIIIAFGFLIRVWAGAESIHIMPSAWLQICMFALALFLGFTKRRHEMLFLLDDAIQHRAVLSEYSKEFLDQMILISSSITILLYGMYSVSFEVTRNYGYGMLYSSVFVIYGIFRYLYLINLKGSADDPTEVLFSDKPLIINISLWLFFIVVIVHLFHR